MKLGRNLMLLGMVTLSGCASGTHQVTGHSRPAIKPDDVQVFHTTPDGAEVIGTVTANDVWDFGDEAYIKCIIKMKKEAAQMGANGIVPTSLDDAGWMGEKTEADAIFVPDQQ